MVQYQGKSPIEICMWLTFVNTFLMEMVFKYEILRFFASVKRDKVRNATLLEKSILRGVDLSEIISQSVVTCDLRH